MGLRTVVGWDQNKKSDLFPDGEPLFAKNGSPGLEFKNANGDIPGVGLGYQRVTSTLTYIKKLITVPKYYEIDINKYLPVVIGDGAYAEELLTHITINSSGDFEDGLIFHGNDNAQLSKVNAGISSKTVPVVTWAKTVDYTEPQIQQALFANNWNIINAKHESRQMNYELGIQQLSFLGSRNNPNAVAGLLTQPNVNINTGLIPQAISTMNPATYMSLIAGLYEAYRQNCNRSARPNRFVIPESDYNGLAVSVNANFPTMTEGTNVSMLKWLMNAFAELGLNVEILPCSYGMPEFNEAYGLNLNRYALYNYEEESLRMDIPVPIRSTMPGTLNNFQFQDAAWAMFSGAWAYRELEMLYFDWS